MTFPASFLRANAPVLTLILAGGGIALMALEPWPVRAVGVLLLGLGLLMPFLRLGVGSGAPQRSTGSVSEIRTPLEDLHLDKQTLNVLAYHNISTVGDLLATDPDELLGMQGIGPRKLLSIRHALVEHGILPSFYEEEAEGDIDQEDHSTTVETVVKWLREQPAAGERA